MLLAASAHPTVRILFGEGRSSASATHMRQVGERARGTARGTMPRRKRAPLATISATPRPVTVTARCASLLRTSARAISVAEANTAVQTPKAVIAAQPDTPEAHATGTATAARAAEANSSPPR